MVTTTSPNTGTQPARYGAGAADHDAVLRRAFQDLHVVVVERLRLLRPFPAEAVRAVHVVQHERILAEMMELLRFKPAALAQRLPVVVAHGEDVRLIQHTVREIRGRSDRAAAKMCLRDRHKLFCAQDLRQFDDLSQRDPLGFALLSPEHALFVFRQPYIHKRLLNCLSAVIISYLPVI
ncbi:MAG: hypothetical protein IKW92_01280 [Firmicutes bacterium]|nr:hypothetical protein [Bacillota bacterium]